jgi:hypothetical protein
LKGLISELGTAAFNLTDKELASLNADALIDRIAAAENQWIKVAFRAWPVIVVLS